MNMIWRGDKILGLSPVKRKAIKWKFKLLIKFDDKFHETNDCEI